MGFSYHPPTRSKCEVCEHLLSSAPEIPIISTLEGKASSSNGYPFHDWYNFVLGYTPKFPEYILQKEGIRPGSSSVILDPFNGSGTTQLVCKLKEITSWGIDANDFMVFASQQKLNWSVDPLSLQETRESVKADYIKKAGEIDWANSKQLNILSKKYRPAALDTRYISDKPLIKISLLRDSVYSLAQGDIRELLIFAITSIIVPISNIKYGPGFSVGKGKEDADVLGAFCDKVDLMISDLKKVTPAQKSTPATTILGDSRSLSQYIPQNSISLIITSPPIQGIMSIQSTPSWS